MTHLKQAPMAPLSGVADVQALGAGDSYLVANLLPPELADVAFSRIKEEVNWMTMYHRADESPPLSPFSPTVQQIRQHVQKVLHHPVNHVLIQLYRSGKDYISEHSDKTIDVVRGSNIVNVSLGAQRTMTLRLKKDMAKASPSSYAPSSSGSIDITENMPSKTSTPRPAQRIPLPHNSMFVMGLRTNAEWLHSIKHDNRPLHTKLPEEQAFDGERVSLTFRHIGTFLSSDHTYIWGQGATGKRKEEAEPISNDKEQIEQLLCQFGVENQTSAFDWDQAYGRGFDVLHLAGTEAEAKPSE
ncbi:hypothetical protein D9613_009202 [Agrocybe pediades]|uniref:Fe2OG dioxygenase domain-containing protein n=1 Tax=Agrocybe pediades TaxID=84607 RepID=A0A8H4R517_9AGAR|nr:hypothetical protein D9613_009202 [Agrocybe pediades]